MKNSESKHLSSNITPVFICQAFMVISAVLVLSFALFLGIYGDSHKPSPKIITEELENNIINLSVQAMEEGVDEADFVESKPKGISDDRFENLFPELKN